MKLCQKCSEYKGLNLFSKNKNSKDGVTSICKECCKIYRQNNKERLLLQKKEYYQRNKEKIVLYKRRYRQENKDLMSELGKNYRNSFVKSNHNLILIEGFKLYEETRQIGEFLEVKCTYCGKWFSPTKLQIRKRLDAINKTNGKESRLYCSDNCKKECPTYRQRKYPKDYKKATSREVQPELRQMVLERDNYICQKCFKTDVPLHCHHKEGIHWEPIESADMDMCITYCKTCHEKVHQIEGCGYNDMKCGK